MAHNHKVKLYSSENLQLSQGTQPRKNKPVFVFPKTNILLLILSIIYFVILEPPTVVQIDAQMFWKATKIINYFAQEFVKYGHKFWTRLFELIVINQEEHFPILWIFPWPHYTPSNFGRKSE